MQKHSVTIDLEEFHLDSLQARVASGEYESASEVVETALLFLDLPEGECIDPDNLPQWVVDEAKAAYDEDFAHPELALSSEQLDAHLAAERAGRIELAKAS